MTLRDLVNKAADRADLSVTNQVAANGLSLLVWTMVEAKQLKLPVGALGIIGEVLKERTGHRYSGGMLRWYRSLLSTDEARVSRFITLPDEYHLLVRASQAAVHVDCNTEQAT